MSANYCTVMYCTAVCTMVIKAVALLPTVVVAGPLHGQVDIPSLQGGVAGGRGQVELDHHLHIQLDYANSFSTI